MARLLYALLVGLVGAAIVHIAVLILLPTTSERDAWTRLVAAGGLYEPVPFDASAGQRADPLFESIACRFDLEDAPLHMSGEIASPFWSMSVYDRAGRNLFSLNDRMAEGGLVDVVVLTRAQLLALRQDLPEGTESIFAEVASAQGFAVLRAFVPDETWRSGVSASLSALACERR